MSIHYKDNFTLKLIAKSVKHSHSYQAPISTSHAGGKTIVSGGGTQTGTYYNVGAGISITNNSQTTKDYKITIYKFSDRENRIVEDERSIYLSGVKPGYTKSYEFDTFKKSFSEVDGYFIEDIIVTDLNENTETQFEIGLSLFRNVENVWLVNFFVRARKIYAITLLILLFAAGLYSCNHEEINKWERERRITSRQEEIAKEALNKKQKEQQEIEENEKIALAKKQAKATQDLNIQRCINSDKEGNGRIERERQYKIKKLIESRNETQGITPLAPLEAEKWASKSVGVNVQEYCKNKVMGNVFTK